MTDGAAPVNITNTCIDEEARANLVLLTARVKVVEDTHLKLLDMSDTLDKIAKRIKYWGPAIISAAVASGVASGKWGAFFSALLSGHP